MAEWNPWQTYRDKKTYPGYYNKEQAPSTPLNVEDFSQLEYTTDDLIKDQFYLPIEDYMVDRFGTHMREKSREEVISQYLNNRRGVAGGNSVRAINEITYLSGLDEQQLQRAGKAYAIFEGLPNIYSDKASWSDTIGGTFDYARSAILDPVNLLGGVISKSLTSGGLKGTSMAAVIGARKAYEKTMTKSIAKGLTQEVASAQANKVAMRVFQGAQNVIQKKAAAKAAWRNTTIQGVKSATLGKIATKGNLVEAGTYAFIDAAAAGATDWAYQTGLYQTGVIDDRSLVQTGVTALASMVLSGSLTALGGALTKRGDGSIVGPDLKDLKSFRKGAKLQTITTTLKKNAANVNKRQKYGQWMTDVANGKDIGDLDTSFWTTLVVGNDDAGIKGLAHVMDEQGLYYLPVDENDKFSNFLGDLLRYADPDEFKDFMKGIEDVTGKDVSNLTQNEFADTFKRKVSQALGFGGEIGRLAQQYGVDEKFLTKGDIFSSFIDGGSGNWTKAIENKVHPFINKTIPRTQNQFIRLLVSNLATTQLNLLGWSVASAMDTATDLVTATLQLPYNVVTGKGTKDFLISARNVWTKLSNTLDPNTTADEFFKYANARPKQLRELMNVLPGGVENGKKFYNQLELDAPIGSMRFDQVVDFLQDTQLVRAQDAYTKSIEFMSSLDKGIRKQYGKSYKEFMADPNYWKMMHTEEFKNIEREAVTVTLDNIFSRSYGAMPNALGELADIIEKARNIPLIGVYMPFGRFFNNTVAFMSDYGGLSLVMKTVGLNQKSTESMKSLAARTAVGWATIFTLAQRESSFLDMGLNWDEQTHLGDATGAITSEKYNFPYAFFKAAARLVAYKAKGQEIPEEVMLDIGRTLGPESFTRDFADAFGAGGQTILDIIQGDEGATSIITNIFGKMAGQAASSATRFLEPMNSAIGIVQGQDRVVADRRQGNQTLNNALRYMDNIISLVDEPRYTATRGKQRPQDSKFIAPVREVKTTNMSRLAATVGVPEWDSSITMIGAAAPEASNRYAKYYNEINERAAGNLLDNPTFKKADLETKRVLFSQLLSKNKKFITDYMEADITHGDAKLMMVAKLQNNKNKKALPAVMKELGLGDKDLMDLDEEELHLIDGALKVRDDVLTLRP